MKKKVKEKKYNYRFHFFCAGHKKVKLIESVGMYEAEMSLRQHYGFIDIFQIDLLSVSESIKYQAILFT